MEPVSRRARRTRMRSRLLPPALLAASLLAVAACGSSGSVTTDGGQAPSGSDRSGGSQASGVGPCRADDPALAGARVLTGADLDGDGTPEQVKLTGPGTGCPNYVFAEVGGRLAATPLGDPLPVQSAREVTVGQEHLVALTQVHPRGGSGVRLLAYDGQGSSGALRELTAKGQPLVPFTATDAGADTPMSADCVDGRLAVTTAQRQQPPGVIAAWTVTRTTYDVTHGAVTGEQTAQVDANALDSQLDQEYPGLRQHRMFQHCR